MSSITISSPAKVLLAGGYLVLDRNYQGLVFALDCRIYVRVQVTEPINGRKAPENIVVRSPQFHHAHWVYAAQEEDGVVRLRQTTESESGSRNVFVETALTYALTYLLHVPGTEFGNLEVTILSDNDYYSHTGRRQQRFTAFDVSLEKAHKTGLGSSASLVTSLTAALITVLSPVASDEQSIDRRRIHNLAQAAHCAAQGKVGSGFDVAAATYGSCLYRRFSASILENVNEPARLNFGEQLHRIVEDLDDTHKWNAEIVQEAAQLPATLQLAMCDVDCGSQSPRMAKKVLAWREANRAEADVLWASLQQGLVDLVTELRSLAALAADISKPNYQNLHDILSTIRSLVREMSDKSGVPIEPASQTKLIDACSNVKGVVGGVVPGAGGFDAIALLLENKPQTMQDLQNLLTEWNNKATAATTDEPTSTSRGKVNLLHVQQDLDGVRVESEDVYSSYLSDQNR